jgi:hypothetical protein
MSVFPNTPAAQPARPDAIGARIAHAWLFALLAVLMLAFRHRLPAGYRRLLARGDALPPSFLAAFAPDAPGHAACIALGQVPDWILPGIRNRGMRPIPAPRPRPRPHARE